MKKLKLTIKKELDEASDKRLCDIYVIYLSKSKNKSHSKAIRDEATLIFTYALKLHKKN